MSPADDEVDDELDEDDEDVELEDDDVAPPPPPEFPPDEPPPPPPQAATIRARPRMMPRFNMTRLYCRAWASKPPGVRLGRIA